MKKVFFIAEQLLFFGIAVLLITCNSKASRNDSNKDSLARDTTVAVSIDSFPLPFATKSVRNMSKVIGWPAGKTPSAPSGFIVTKFAEGLAHPRWIYVADNGDIFVAETNKENSANQITLLRDKNKDNIAERHVFLQNLNMPFGMLIIGDKFYVANTDALVVFPYKPGAVSITEASKKLVDLPAGPRHWTRNIITSKNKDKIYIAVGSASNVAEDGTTKEERRAAILEVNTDGSGERIYASGLRNPVGMAWAPGTQTLWTTVNERDELGDDLVPDYLTSVKDSGFYGWPYSYFGQHEDPRTQDFARPDLVAKAIVPDISLGSHTASLGLVFYNGKSFPSRYRGGAFIGQHGSWNRASLVGYKVVFVPFNDGKSAGPVEDFLSGFIANLENSEVYGRPVGVAVASDGSLLVADDASNTIWKVSYKG